METKLHKIKNHKADPYPACSQCSLCIILYGYFPKGRYPWSEHVTESILAAFSQAFLGDAVEFFMVVILCLG